MTYSFICSVNHRDLVLNSATVVAIKSKKLTVEFESSRLNFQVFDVEAGKPRTG
jgi:hypothetical protein